MKKYGPCHSLCGLWINIFNPIRAVAVIFLPASLTHNICSGMQSLYFSKSQDAVVLQTCHEK